MNNLNLEVSRQRCLKYRERILDISQQVDALHGAGAFSTIEIVDCIYNELMRFKPFIRDSPGQ
jgi:transketolase